WCSKTRKECVSIKADFEKAFDNVRWPFLKRIMLLLGFSEKWWSWIEQCVCQTPLPRREVDPRELCPFKYATSLPLRLQSSTMGSAPN
ncbi:hypothetical protein ACMD2_27185, partial [Ananas comosus]